MSITIVQNILKEVSSGCHATILPYILCKTLVPYDTLKVGVLFPRSLVRAVITPFTFLPPHRLPSGRRGEPAGRRLSASSSFPSKGDQPCSFPCPTTTLLPLMLLLFPLARQGPILLARDRKESSSVL